MDTAALLERLRAADDRPFAEPPIRVRRIAIVGGGPTRMEAPFEEPESEVWTLNHVYYDMPRVDRVFEIHALDVLAAETQDGVPHLQRLAEERLRPIYMVAAHPDIRCSVPFPLEAVMAFFSWRCPKMRRRPYMMSTCAYMMVMAARAIVLQRESEFVPQADERISLHGVDAIEGSSYEHQRANLELTIGLALGLGIEVDVAEESELLAGPWQYGGFA